MALLPPTEVYAILRENGFSPLGIPRQRGLFYMISVIDRRGDDGRLVIDARTGRIVRFVPAYRMGDNFNDEPTRRLRSGRTAAADAAISEGRAAAAGLGAAVASRTPRCRCRKRRRRMPAKPKRSKIASPMAAKPAPSRRSNRPPCRPSRRMRRPRRPAAVPIVAAKPAAADPADAEMPKVQGLD